MILIFVDAISPQPMLEKQLSDKGFTVQTTDSLVVFQYALTKNIKAIIWDVESPDMIKEESFATVLNWDHIAKLVISKKGDIRTKIMGYEAGIDMFFEKPVDLSELSCVIANLLGKLSRLNPQLSKVDFTNAWTLHSGASNLLTPTDYDIALTQKEGGFLVELMGADNLTVSKEQLLKKLGYEAKGLHGRKAMDVMLTRLRRKIKDKTDLDVPIKTIYQQGFQFTGPYCIQQ